MNKRRRYKAKRRRADKRLVARDRIGRKLAAALDAYVTPMPFPQYGLLRVPGH